NRRTFGSQRLQAAMLHLKDPGPVAVTVVDDEPSARDVLYKFARLWGHPCQMAATAEQALELLQRTFTPILVTDLRMPGRGGVWWVREVRLRWPEVSVIVLTAGHDPEAAQKCLDAGAHYYFFKPIKLDEFRHVLETASRTYRLERENATIRTQLER